MARSAQERIYRRIICVKFVRAFLHALPRAISIRVILQQIDSAHVRARAVAAGAGGFVPRGLASPTGLVAQLAKQVLLARIANHVPDVAFRQAEPFGGIPVRGRLKRLKLAGFQAFCALLCLRPLTIVAGEVTPRADQEAGVRPIFEVILSAFALTLADPGVVHNFLQELVPDSVRVAAGAFECVVVLCAREALAGGGAGFTDIISIKALESGITFI